jgi:hypothetical protein
MLKEQDRVRFIDSEKDKELGILIIFKIKGDIATLGNGEYETFGQKMCNVKLSELRRAE